MKRCSKCGFECDLEVVSEHFHKDKAGKHGHKARCKMCQKEYSTKHRRENKAYYKQNGRKFRENNPSYQKQWYVNNKEKYREYDRRWTQNNMKKVLAKNHRRRARISGNGGVHTAQEIENLYKQQNGKCAYCCTDISSGYHVDHRLAISRGGTNDISNISLACAKCNLSKGNKTLSEWILHNQTAGLLDGLEVGF